MLDGLILQGHNARGFEACIAEFRSKLSFLATAGMCLGLLNDFGSLPFLAAVYED